MGKFLKIREKALTALLSALSKTLRSAHMAWMSQKDKHLHEISFDFFTSRKARNSIRISRMTSLLLLWVPCRRRKYKSPNMLGLASVFLGLSVKAVSNYREATNPGMEQQRQRKCWVEEE